MYMVRKAYRFMAFAMTAVITAVIFNGCGRASDTESAARREIFAMDTVMDITCYGEGAQQAASDAEALIHELDALLAVQSEDSEIARINASGGGDVDTHTAQMIETALEVYETSGGAFDITIYPLVKLWGFPKRQLHVPSQKELDAALELVGSDRLEYDAGSRVLQLGKDQEIDLGGIAKGYTGDALTELLRKAGISSAIVSLGGNVQALGTKPDGEKWRCGIIDPHNPDDTEAVMGIIEIADSALVTSGAYERYYTDEKTGAVYHHIIDPHTGMPASSGIISATVVSPSGVLADALSTACYVMGVEKSLDYWEKYGDGRFELILMAEDDEVYITEGLEESFTCKYHVNVKKRP